ncbi:hypothetical protein BKA67DRAFT_553953 [Truncatella angustata]|uniref:Uncharacterized protein n=1 Tax=Truncatella angustata TaxID=152316 RepID=A0A9P9A0E8_9PEZI|nr:uncharacterized protein BKA67DRAFT_553953 [Truncatella angustata]KAH6657004.1 hypothetical protein BKA67DRAFT_553953 [Truncatella angustata]
MAREPIWPRRSECTEACYPFERFGVMSYNPFHHAKQRDSITREPLALEPILVAGAAMDMLHHGDFQLSMLESSVAYILRMINEIRESTTIPYHQTALEKQLTFHALGCITAVSWSTGDLVLWHKHMKLLRQHLEKSGFLLTADPHDMMKVRMADIEGAVIAGVAPSLPYSRQYPLLPCVLPVQDVLLILTKLRPPLQACNVDSDTVDSILAVCIFISTMQMSQEYGLEEKFDPENLMEDYDFLQRDLLTLPQPLGTNMKDTASTTWPSYDGGLSAAMKPSLAFEEAIRVTTLMCLRAANIQAPWSKATYSKLLDILVDRLRVILDWMYESKEDCAFIDPSLLHHREEGFPVNNARRFLIWICMIGYELSVYYTVYHEGWSDHRRKSCLYLQMLGALGIHDEADIDNSDNEELSIFDTINLNWATNNKWQARDMLKWMIK